MPTDVSVDDVAATKPLLGHPPSNTKRCPVPRKTWDEPVTFHNRKKRTPAPAETGTRLPKSCQDDDVPPPPNITLNATAKTLPAAVTTNVLKGHQDSLDAAAKTIPTTAPAQTGNDLPNSSQDEDVVPPGKPMVSGQNMAQFGLISF